MDDASSWAGTISSGRRTLRVRSLETSPRHVVTRGGIDRRILVRVLLINLFVDLVNEGARIPLSVVLVLRASSSLVAVAHILLCNLITTHLHDALSRRPCPGISSTPTAGAMRRSPSQSCPRPQRSDIRSADGSGQPPCWPSDRVRDLINLKWNLLSVPLDDVRLDFHAHALSPPAGTA